MVNSHGRFVWYELMTTDMEAAKAFYAEVVGWGTQDVSMPGMAYTLFTAGGASVSGLMGLPENERTLSLRPSWLGYVDVNDVDATADRIKQLGGAVHVPPMDIPNISRISVAADPQMATIALFKWLNRGEEAGQAQPDPDAPGRVGWHELLAADWEKAFAFYAELFGWQKGDFGASEGDAYQQFSAGGRTIGGMFTKPPTVPVPSWLYYFNVGDIDDALKRVKAGRGQIVDGPIEVVGGRWIAQCTDPQGALFALVGKRRHNGIGYFERVASRDPSNPRFGVACTRFG
jgi:predicted enzyme related to lactoylglutathione lyase